MKENSAITHEDHITIARFLNNTLDPSELMLFQERMEKNPDFRAAVTEILEIWDLVPDTIPEINSNPDQALEKVAQRLGLHEQKPARIIRPRWHKMPLKFAATLALLAVTATIFWLLLPAPVQIHSTARTNLLADGTIVYLADGAFLEYPKNFDQEQREVILSGRAYFDVQPDSERPFVIQGVQSSVTVLGTEFDLTMDSLHTHISVTEGSVSLASSDQRVKEILRAGESAGIDLKTKQLMEKTPAPVLSGTWATGQLIFNQAPLNQLVEALNEYFDVKIRLQGHHLDQCQITTRFNHPELTEIIEELSLLLNLSVERQGEQIILSGQGCKSE